MKAMPDAAANPHAWIDTHAGEALDAFWKVCSVSLQRAVAPKRTSTVFDLHGVLGDWLELVEHHARAASASGANLSAASDIVRTLGDELLTLLADAYAREPVLLVATIRVLNDWLSSGRDAAANAYLGARMAVVHAREEDLSTTLDSIGDAVVVTDETGCVVRMNPVAERLTGFSVAESLGRPLASIFRIEDETSGETVESPVMRVLAEGIIAGLASHTVLVAKDGTRRPITDSGAPVRREGGKIRGVVLVFRDVSDERRAQQALLHWERIFQHATWGVAVASASDVRFQAVNPAYASMHGYTVDELVGAPVSTLWGPETRADMERHAKETHHHGRLVAETTHICKNGDQLPVEVVATTIKNAEGVVEWFVANVQDITERKRLQRSRIRAMELEAENRRIDEANQLKSEFLANMSHELRTPLNSIIGFAELLHDEQVGALDAKQKEFLQEILVGGRHLLRLINDVLDLAKVEAGKIELRVEPVDIDALVNQVVLGQRATVRERDLSIDVAIGPGLGSIVTDPGRFKQVLYNYVSNALKFTPNGGRVIVRVNAEGEDFRLEVEDTGVGVSEENLKRLFVAFQQIDAGAARRHGGTGLGLALTKRLVEAQGGSVGMRHRQGGGCIFYATLPQRPAEYAAARSHLESLASLLVVDPDPAQRSLLVHTLRQAGYGAEAVATCKEAVAAWGRHRYAALVVDLVEGNGHEFQMLLDTLHASQIAPIPVIALSVAGKDSAAGFALTDILPKPVEKELLFAALERCGVSPSRGRPVAVIDDDLGSLKLMAATLAQLGYESVCYPSAREALASLSQLRPAAIVLDLVMPDMDGLAFLERFRSFTENRTIPVMVWTVKDLSAEERASLHASVATIVQKGVQDGSRLVVALQAFLGADSPQRGVDL